MTTTYNTELQSNNTDLQSLIDKANALPDKVNIDTELATQDSLISQIATALEGKSAGSGGASVETCTVQISATGFPLVGYVATLFDGTEYQASTAYNNNGLGVVTLENVVCGSAVMVQVSGTMVGHTVGGGVEIIGYITSLAGRVFRAPTTAGAAGTIAAYYND